MQAGAAGDIHQRALRLSIPCVLFILAASFRDWLIFQLLSDKAKTYCSHYNRAH